MDVLLMPLPAAELSASIHSKDQPSIKNAWDDFCLRNPPAPAILSPAAEAAIDMKDYATFKLILDRAGPSERIAKLAAQSEDAKMVDLVLCFGWFIDRSLEHGIIPSIISYAIHNLQFLDWLLSERRADPNAVSVLNETALSFAVRRGSMNVCKRLVTAGTDLSKGDLLHCVTDRESSEDTVELIEMFMCSSLSPNSYQWDNPVARILRYGYPWSTPLHTACRENNIVAVEALLKHGADPTLCKKQNGLPAQPTPLDMMPAGSRIGDLLRICQPKLA